jgi:uncharacterized protein YdbL (DUF1318 family)
MAEDKVADVGVSDEEIAQPVDQSQEETADELEVAGEKPVDLSKHPQFRKMQSEYQKRIAQFERQNQALAMQVEELATRGMDGEELTEYQQQQMERALQDRDTELNELRSRLARQDALQNIAVEAEVPLSEIAEANTPDEAWRMAISYIRSVGKKKAATKARAEQKKMADNEVVVGGGGAVSSQDDWEKKVDAAYKSGRTTEYVRLLRQKPTG